MLVIAVEPFSLDPFRFDVNIEIRPLVALIQLDVSLAIAVHISIRITLTRDDSCAFFPLVAPCLACGDAHGALRFFIEVCCSVATIAIEGGNSDIAGRLRDRLRVGALA